MHIKSLVSTSPCVGLIEEGYLKQRSLRWVAERQVVKKVSGGGHFSFFLTKTHNNMLLELNILVTLNMPVLFSFKEHFI